MKNIIVFLALLALSECKKVPDTPTTCVDHPQDPTCGPSVEVGLYYESLCGPSKAFFTQMLYPTYTKINASSPNALRINLVPFGNAYAYFIVNSTKNPALNFTWQHGPQEGVGNMLASCALVKFGTDKGLSLVNCMFLSPDVATPYTAAEECTKQLNLDFNVLNDCYNSEDGIAIEYLMAGQTTSLQPAHKYVPWVSLNGIHTEDIQTKAMDNLLKLFCDTYEGKPKPGPCDATLTYNYRDDFEFEKCQRN